MKQKEILMLYTNKDHDGIIELMMFGRNNYKNRTTTYHLNNNINGQTSEG